MDQRGRSYKVRSYIRPFFCYNGKFPNCLL
nr:MAG TPA: hypothetical protein [Caudoviricetes sp.]